MNRGEIWWANLPRPRASEPGYRRPILIVQADEFNRSRLNTVIALVITSNTRLAKAPGNVLLRQADTGLPKDSVANVSQIMTIDKQFLATCAGSLPRRVVARVEAGLRMAMSL